MKTMLAVLAAGIAIISAAPAHADQVMMVYHYDDAETPEAQHGRQLMMDDELLEGLTHYVNDTLNLPSDVLVLAQQCGGTDVVDSTDGETIWLCYETIEHAERMFANDNHPDPATAALNFTNALFFHELGHALIRVFDLPFTGREEDVADQLGAVLLLAPGEDGKPYPHLVQIALDTARRWGLYAAEAGDEEYDHSERHSFNLQRMYNWLCWIYGSDPEANASIVTSGDLPEDRAVWCDEEFQKMSAGWHLMLEPYLREPD